jgi:transglutaminase-like putative cysteine protease
VTAEGGPCQGIVGTTLVPGEWPEQHVEEASREISPAVAEVGYRPIGSARQMYVSMPFIAAGDDCMAVVVYELKRNALLPPVDTSIFVMPNTKKLKVDTRMFLAPSPSIESTNLRVRTMAREAVKDKSGAWQKVETLYDLVREKVQFVTGPLKSTTQTLKDGRGDSEELSSLFVAFCRACDIPARLVFVSCPGHCYAEFYLEDADGAGYWFPCRPAGNREFGGIEEFRPIIQKGDSFTSPDRPRERLRFITEFLTGKGGQPRVKFVRELVN